MKEYKSKVIRNLALIGHSGSGKTTLTEAMLFSAGAINRQGSVDEGTTTSDYRNDEKERKISIQTSLNQFEFGINKITVLDTPGYSDFAGEVKSALRIADMAIITVHAVAGIEVGTEQVWGFAKERNLGTLLVVNLLDKENSNFDRIVSVAAERLGNGVLPVQFPVNEGVGFDSIIDVLQGKLIKFSKDGSGKEEKSDIPDEYEERAAKFKQSLIDSAAETDDTLLEKYLDSGELSKEELESGIKNGIASGTIHPLYCVSAEKNMGVKILLSALSDYGASPVDVARPSGTKPGSDDVIERSVSENESTSAFIFKTVSEAHVGDLSFVRIYSGSVKSGMDLTNSTQNKHERIAQMYSIKGHERKEVGQAIAGDIAAVVKLKSTHTGDTLSDSDNQITYEKTQYPDTVLTVAVSALEQGDEEKIGTGLSALHAEDPSFHLEIDGELSQMLLHTQGELHMEVILSRLKERFNVDLEKNPPKIPYRETIKSVGDHRAKYKKQSGGRGQYGDAHVKVEPLKRGAGFEFVNKIAGGVIPTKFIPSVEKGIVESIGKGIIADSKIVDLKATVYDGSYHAVDSSDIAFKIAGAMAFKQAFLNAKPVILEPIYDVKVKVPEEHMGDVMGDLTSRRGKISGMDADGHFQIINAKVPLAELYKYSTSIRSITAGRGLHSQSFSHYEETTMEVGKNIMKKVSSEEE
ncbi:MAG: elongation factor G [Candidatus Marinimicrobia bacterium]|nr:elongation factor G [Candidatus Neomarinimicrobiota bacterium]